MQYAASTDRYVEQRKPSRPPALSHHSFAMDDQVIQKTLTGKLTRYVPGSNHAQIFFELLGPDGQPVLENGSLVRWGSKWLRLRSLRAPA